MKTNNVITDPGQEDVATYDVSRRKFFQLAGGLAGAGLLLASCSKGDSTPNGTTPGGTVKLGSGDTGILNYAYALEQLEAAFYTQMVASTSFSTIFSTDEALLLTDIRDHEIAHREFFKAALSSSAIIGLTVDFSAINFSDRTSVLSAARTFEDLGVSAYNYAGTRISNTTSGASYLTVAGKIVSVEARHAAAIRDMISYSSFSFADTLDSNGLDQSNAYSVVLTAAGAYVKNTIDFSQLP